MKLDYIEKLIERSDDVVLMSQAESVRVAQVMFQVIEKKRELLRVEVEDHPKQCPEDLQEDVVFQLGMIKGLNWVLALPDRSRDCINKIK